MFVSPNFDRAAAVQVVPQAGFTEGQTFFPHIEPKWKATAFKRLDEIKALPENWDGYGSPAIPVDLISRMASLVKAIPDGDFPRGVPSPVISPASDGIQIEWDGGHGGVEIILHPDGTGAFVAEIDGKYEDGPLDPRNSFAVVSLLHSVFDESGREFQHPSHNLSDVQITVSPSMRIFAA